MNTETIKVCPKCHAPIPPEAPQGLCPKCLLAAASMPTEAGPAAEAAAPPSLESIATAFPQLEILEFIGQGGMGLVFKARQPKLDRFVALKLLPQKPGADPSFHERFNREARVLARLSHPNIVAVHDFGQAGPFFYLLMEFVDGVNLRQAMRAGRFTPAQALALVPKICDALQYAHEEGILHRDIKPENLLLDTRGRVKIADFGIAKLLGDVKDITLTASGSTIGTPHYMAPEQLERPHDVDQRADVYSLGVVFYEMLTGELPIGRFAPPSQKTPMDPRVDDVVLRALEKERERRFQSAGDVRTQVEKITSAPGENSPSPAGSVSPGTRGNGWSLGAIAAAGLVGLSLLAFLITVIQSDRVGSHEVFLVMVLIGLPGLLGTFLAWRTLREFQAASVRKRGDTLAFLSAFGWPLVLVDLVLFAIPVLFVDSLQWHVLHIRGGPLPDLSRVIVGLAILVLTGFLLRRWLKDWRTTRALPHGEIISQLSRLPRRPTLVAGAAFGVLLFVMLVSRAQMRRSELTEPTSAFSAPTPPPGFEVAEGGVPGQNRMYRAGVTVPAGYALTVTTVLCSNQVVLRSLLPNASLMLLAPAGAPIEGVLSWSLLGNTTFADGAPLHLSLGLATEPAPDTKALHITPPEPITAEWVGEPHRVWPPQNGHSKFLLIKGTPSNPTAEDQPPADWEVGIEARLDPLPSEMLRGLRTPGIIVGTNWLALLQGVPVSTRSNNSPGTPDEESKPEPQASTGDP